MPRHDYLPEEMSLTLRPVRGSQHFERTMNRGVHPGRSTDRYDWMQMLGSRNWFSENIRSEMRYNTIPSDIEECAESILRDVMRELGLTIEGDRTMVVILGMAMQAMAFESIHSLARVRSRYDRSLNNLNSHIENQLRNIREEVQSLPTSDQIENLNRIQKKIEQFKTADSDAERLYAWEVLMGYIDEQTTFEEFTRSRESVVIPDLDSFNVSLDDVDEAIRTVGRDHRLPTEEQVMAETSVPSPETPEPAEPAEQPQYVGQVLSDSRTVGTSSFTGGRIFAQNLEPATIDDSSVGNLRAWEPPRPVIRPATRNSNASVSWTWNA